MLTVTDVHILDLDRILTEFYSDCPEAIWPAQISLYLLIHVNGIFKDMDLCDSF